MDPKRIEVVDDLVAAALREMGPARRLELVFQANRFTRTLVEAGVKGRNPGWGDEQVRKEVARIWLHGSE
ncbi:MAG: hypothetical protein HY896_04045 [Deltaproteobacteria bacterium]|nr:hypothetical protein [Deltaproteobacteria bacterium]